jgi:hypothetical protein
MDAIDKIKYVIEIYKINGDCFGITDIVPVESVFGNRHCNDSDEDYYDHYYIEQSCWEGLYSGVCFYPLDDESKEYIKVEWTD